MVPPAAQVHLLNAQRELITALMLIYENRVTTPAHRDAARQARPMTQSAARPGASARSPSSERLRRLRRLAALCSCRRCWSRSPSTRWAMPRPPTSRVTAPCATSAISRSTRVGSWIRFGVIAVFMALVGWGRRVPIQPNRINTMRQRLVYQLGGPAANLLVAVVLGPVLRALVASALRFDPGCCHGVSIGALVYVIVFLNLSIFAFQLLPIPGLDGWDVVETLFRSRNPRFFYNVVMP